MDTVQIATKKDQVRFREVQTRILDLSKSFTKMSQLFKSDSNSNFQKIATQILEELGASLNCQWGTYWKVSAETLQLHPFATWTEHGFDAPALNRDTKGRTLTISEGTAGHVWRSRKPVWTLDLIKDMCLPRSLDADSSGLTGGIWFALKTENTVYAVIELLGRQVTPPTEELIVGIENFGIQLGHLVQEYLA